ncbi:MAG TPA: formyltransferase family protein, partial [Micavibrio sp.]
MKILFLGYDRDQTSLISFLEEEGCVVHHVFDKIESGAEYDLVISFGYRHILRRSFLAGLKRPALNLHMSLLPYNRGAHPNFWAWYDGTPHGVSIHHIDEGLDTGDIVAQHSVVFADNRITFKESYDVLFKELEELFKEFWPSILNYSYVVTKQQGVGSLHRKSDLPSFSGWDNPVYSVIKQLRG